MSFALSILTALVLALSQDTPTFHIFDSQPRGTTRAPIRLKFLLLAPSLDVALFHSMESAISSKIEVFPLEVPLVLSGVSLCGEEIVIPKEHSSNGFSNVDSVMYVTVTHSPNEHFTVYGSPCVTEETGVLAGKIVINSAVHMGPEELVDLVEQEVLEILNGSRRKLAVTCGNIKDCASCDSAGVTCYDCNKGMFPLFGGCEKCSTFIGYCVDCSTDGRSCLECSPDTYLVNVASCNSCHHIIPYCELCDNLGTECYDCAKEYFIMNKKCTPCTYRIINCSDCTEDGEICFDCYAGFVLDPVKSTCGPCEDYISYCEFCTKDGTKCTSCYEEAILDNFSCIACSEFIDNCRTCSHAGSICTRCHDQHYLEGNVCKPCEVVEGCDNYHTDCSCLICSEGYFIYGPSCSPCSLYVRNCEICSATGWTCNQCSKGYYLENN